MWSTISLYTFWLLFSETNMFLIWFQKLTQCLKSRQNKDTDLIQDSVTLWKRVWPATSQPKQVYFCKSPLGINLQIQFILVFCNIPFSLCMTNEIHLWKHMKNCTSYTPKAKKKHNGIQLRQWKTFALFRNRAEYSLELTQLSR